MSKFALRDYQERSVTQLINFILDPNNQGKHPLMDLCTGSGKSVMIAETIKRLLNLFPSLNILSLVHTKELVEQNQEKFAAIVPHIRSSIFMGSLGKKDSSAKVVFGSIQSVSKDMDLFEPNIIFVDECHWIQKKSAGMYRAFIDHVKEKFPHVLVIGWTGTVWRTDGGSLVDGKDKLFDEVVARVSVKELLDLGYLSPIVVPSHEIQSKRAPTMQAEIIHGTQTNYTLVKSITSSGSDYVDQEDQELIDNTVEEYRWLSKGRKKHLVFGSRKKHCHQLKEAFSKYYKVEHIHGTMLKSKREKYIKMFKDGELDMLVSGIVLTTGFDAPEVDCIGLCRSVQSSALYAQIVGRGLRIAEGKQNCLWLDFTETTEVHGPVDKLEPPPYVESDKKGEAPFKICPVCSTSGEPFKLAPTTTHCPQCEYEFDMSSGVNHNDKAGSASVLSAEPEWRKLTMIKAEKYTSQVDKAKMKKIQEKLSSGSLLSQEEERFQPKNNMKITFSFGLSSYTKIICFDDPKTRHEACLTWSWIVQDEYKHSCPHHAESALFQINESGVLKPIGEMKFTYETHYNGGRGKQKLHTPRLDRIIDVR